MITMKDLVNSDTEAHPYPDCAHEPANDASVWKRSLTDQKNKVPLTHLYDSTEAKLTPHHVTGRDDDKADLRALQSDENLIKLQ